MNRKGLCRSLVLALSLLCLSSASSAQTKEVDFTLRMAARFRSALPGRTIEVSEPLQLRLAGKGEPSEINVGRIFNYCANATAADCETSIAEFVAGMTEAYQNLDKPITRDQLRLVVRSSDYCEYIEQSFPQDKPRPVMRPFVSGLCTLLMVDFPTRTQTASAENLTEIGLELEPAWALAERQTLAGLPTPATIEGLSKGIAAVAGFDYATSLMLNEKGWRAAAARHGELVAAVPDGNVMIVARFAKVGDLAEFKAVVRRHFETAERGVSPTVYRWGASGWVPLD